MILFSVGRLCLKLAGRDAGRKCVVVEILDDSFVLVDGDVRRKKVNLKHLEPLAQTLELPNNASHEEVKKVFEKMQLPVWDTKKKATPARQKKVKKVHEAPAVEPKEAKKAAKKSKKEAAEPSALAEEKDN